MFRYIQDYSGSFSAFWTFSGLTLAGAAFLVFCVPETKDRTAEDIADFFYKEPETESAVTSTVDISHIV